MLDHDPETLRPDLHLDAAPVGRLRERWPPWARPSDHVRVYLGHPGWAVTLERDGGVLRWTLDRAGVGAIGPARAAGLG